MTDVYFATNRLNDGIGPNGFGATIVPADPAQITYAVANVTNVQPSTEDSGVIESIRDRNMGNFSIAAQDAITGSNRNLLIFIHGASNTFEDAIKRAAFNCEWFADTGAATAKTTVVAFTWPSAEITPGNIIKEYKVDQAQAGRSGFHIVSFLKNIAALRRNFTTVFPQGRVFLLAHSMGNHALQAGIMSWFELNGPNERIFDQVFLAAPDEIADTFERPGGGGSGNLRILSDRISIYYSRDDRLMWASAAANQNERLGFNGPSKKMDPTIYPSARFRMIDCTLALDFNHLFPWDASHQYYRRSKAVRTDIVKCMIDNPRPPGGLGEVSTLPLPPPIIV